MKATIFLLIIMMLAGSISTVFARPQTGSIIGRVVDETKAPIGGAVIALIVFDERGNRVFVMKTRTNGGDAYSFIDVPYGRVRMAVRAGERGGANRGFSFFEPVHIENFVL